MSVYRLAVLPAPLATPTYPTKEFTTQGIRKALQATRKLYPYMSEPYAMDSDSFEAFSGDVVISVSKAP